MSKKKINKKKRKKIIIVLVTILIILILGLFIFNYYDKKRQIIENNNNKIAHKEEIEKHYNSYVKTNKKTKLYILKENGYKVIGTINEDIFLTLGDVLVEYNTEYFPVTNFEEVYYIKYDTVSPVEEIPQKDDRYKKYIPFDKNVKTSDVTNFYQDDKLLYSINKSYDFPIIIDEDDRYYVDYNNNLLEIKKENVIEVYDNVNSSLEKATKIRTIAYHSFYDPDDKSESWCRNSICHPVSQIEEHAKYIKENEYFTLNMKEVERFIDGKINVPKKSVIITIDDGLMAERGIEVLDKYQLNATVFLITSSYKKEDYLNSPYIEFHSHGDNLHNQGICPGGQGGAIKCQSREILLEDLAKSREKLNNTTVFCYPFYEYNDYSISVLKEAGFTMAFAGNIKGGYVTVGMDKMQIPRYTITRGESVNSLARVIK